MPPGYRRRARFGTSTYTENSWITQYSTLGPIDLIHRTQNQINANYPGTKLSFSEYNYGAGEDISGGLAEADVLGIFGKYGVYSANEWPSSSPNDNFVAGAFQLYRNYDGHDSTFGNTEVLANNSDTVNTSVYASVDSANSQHLTLMAINKENSPVTATLSVAGGPAYKTAAVYQLTAATSTPQFVGNIAITNPASFNYSMPAYSATMFSFFVPGQTVGTWGISTGGSWPTLGDWLGRRRRARAIPRILRVRSLLRPRWDWMATSRSARLISTAANPTPSRPAAAAR